MIFYTCITNGYDTLSDETVAVAGVRYVCFYDGEVEKKGPWEFIKLDLDIDCHVRRSYHPKHLPQNYFDADEQTVWIDACYPVTEELVEFSRELFEDCDFALQKHPDHRGYLSEMGKLYGDGFSSREQIIDMSRRAASRGYTIKEYKQTINCVIWRKITPAVMDWCQSWSAWYMGGVNRDQISSSIAEFEMKKKYRTPILFEPKRVNLQVDITDLRYRKKKYEESYNLLPKPSMNDRISLVDQLYDIFGEKPDGYEFNKMYAHLRYPPMALNDTVQPEDMIVYTCITNGYDEFPKQNWYHPDVRYVCFHDGTIDTTVKPWEYIDVRDCTNETCPRRLSFFPKANPHLFFPKGSNTIWIDGCYVHKPQFIEVSKNCFPFTMVRHASRFTYFDEMLEGFTCAFFSYDDGIKLTTLLKAAGFDFKSYGSPLGTIVWRTITDEIETFDKLWYEWSLIGSNRDQVAFDMAMKNYGGSLPSVIENRQHTGVPLGYFNKKGRRGMHPQRGDMKQYLRKDEFLQEMADITGLDPKIYCKYERHDFYMKVYNVL